MTTVGLAGMRSPRGQAELVVSLVTALLDYGSKLTPTAPRRPPTPALRRIRRDGARWLARPLQITAHEGEGLLDRLGAAVLGTLGCHRVQNRLENDERLQYGHR